MNTRESVAVVGGLAIDEVALKHLTMLFHRIAVPELPVQLSFTHLFTSDFAEARAELVDAGVLFKPDENLAPRPAHGETANLLLRDSDEILKPSTGLNTKEFIAAKRDETKFPEIKNKRDEFNKKLSEGQVDLQKLLDAGKRISTNLTRLMTAQLRQDGNLDAYAVVPAEFDSLHDEDDDEGSDKHDVMKIALTSLPAPSDDVSWKQVIEYRSDPDSHNRFMDIKDWMTETARGKLTPVEVQEKLESLLDQYRKHFQIHQMNTINTSLEVFIVTTADALRSLATVRWGKAASLFSLQRRKVSLLQEESASEGSVVAFAMKTEILDFLS
jgi:hypothetical protein